MNISLIIKILDVLYIQFVDLTKFSIFQRQN